MTLVRILSLLGGLVLLAAIIWAALTAGQSLNEAIAWLISGPWGVVSLIDLYLGFFFIGVLIWLLEPSKPVALLFILPLPILGNVWAAVWMAWRLAHVIRARGAEPA
ncbi:MAG: hypothetical protein JJU18_02815 [Oceanicaulis sp.]|nr:hypothetical protein [Oceanicaulis sp.]